MPATMNMRVGMRWKIRWKKVSVEVSLWEGKSQWCPRRARLLIGLAEVGLQWGVAEVAHEKGNGGYS